MRAPCFWSILFVRVYIWNWKCDVWSSFLSSKLDVWSSFLTSKWAVRFFGFAVWYLQFRWHDLKWLLNIPNWEPHTPKQGPNSPPHNLGWMPRKTSGRLPEEGVSFKHHCFHMILITFRCLGVPPRKTSRRLWQVARALRGRQREGVRLPSLDVDFACEVPHIENAKPHSSVSVQKWGPHSSF